MSGAERRVRKALIKETGRINARLITPEANLRDTLGLDSLDLFLVSMNLEAEYKDVCKSQTVRDLVAIVEQQNK